MRIKNNPHKKQHCKYNNTTIILGKIKIKKQNLNQKMT